MTVPVYTFGETISVPPDVPTDGARPGALLFIRPESGSVERITDERRVTIQVNQSGLWHWRYQDDETVREGVFWVRPSAFAG